MKRLFFIILPLLLLSACSTKQIIKSPDIQLKAVSQNVATISIHGSNTIDDALIGDLTKYLKAKLIIAGFDLNENAEGLILDVNVTAFTPGSATARLLVGFGAGRGSLLYTAKYTDANGKVLAELAGQERFTGGELSFRTEYGNAFERSDEEVRKLLVQEAAKHIVELASR